jgi:hypothetical protein
MGEHGKRLMKAAVFVDADPVGDASARLLDAFEAVAVKVEQQRTARGVERQLAEYIQDY